MIADSGKTTDINKELLTKIQQVLSDKGFETVILNSEKEVKDYINREIPDEQIVGLGDSITTCTLNIRNILYGKGSTIFYSWDGSETYNRSLDTFENMTKPAYYLSRATAIASDGNILLKDYSKNAARKGSFPEKIYVFAGMNRLVEAFEDRESVDKYALVDTLPANTKFSVALLPYLCY